MKYVSVFYYTIIYFFLIHVFRKIIVSYLVKIFIFIHLFLNESETH